MRVTNHEIYSASNPADSFGCHAHIVGVATESPRHQPGRPDVGVLELDF